MNATKIRKLGEKKYLLIEHEEGECPACCAGHCTDWSSGDIIFFELENGKVFRVENVGLGHLCGEVTMSDALEELYSYNN